MLHQCPCGGIVSFNGLGSAAHAGSMAWVYAAAKILRWTSMIRWTMLVLLAQLLFAGYALAEKPPTSWAQFIKRDVNPACRASGADYSGGAVSVTFTFPEKGQQRRDALRFIFEEGSWVCDEPLGRCVSFHHICTDTGGGPWPPKSR